ncbi:MAG TPA: CBS domain-containing protein [Nitrospiraceae bacterium]|nr:CBS domain-containing protein [Nitrospiraceae bacterium]
MKVRDIMTRDVQCCGPDTNLAVAAKMMWDSDCGVLPVLNVEGRVLGVITDRDICVAVATRNKLASEITVWEPVTGKACTCRDTDDIHTTLDIMKREKVRRLPVVDEDGLLQGMLSMNDLVLNAEETKGKKAPALSFEDVMYTLKVIGAHRMLVGI